MFLEIEHLQKSLVMDYTYILGLSFGNTAKALLF